MPFKQVQPATIVHQIIDQILDILQSGEISEGEKLPSERKLAEMFGASRPTVREAITALSVIGVLEIRRGVGTYVQTTDVTQTLGTRLSSYLASGANPIDAIEMRSLLEPRFAALAAERAEKDDLERMQAALQVAEEQVSLGSLYLEADLDFHAAIAAATGNPLAERALGPSLELWFFGDAEASKATMSARGRLAKYHEQHGRIYQAIKDRDADRAFEEMREHFSSIEADFRTTAT